MEIAAAAPANKGTCCLMVNNSHPPYQHHGVNPMSLYRSFAFFFCFSVLVLSGCSGDGKLQPRGKILKGGSPFTVPEEEYVRITFHPIPADGSRARHVYAAVYNHGDATFKVVGADGKGLPPGKYRVAIEHERNRKDLFKGAYDADRSRWVFDLDSSSKEIVIDLDNKA
jgi:hypothetical protein